MSIENLDNGACRAMGVASTDQAAPGVRALGIALADYSGADGSVLLTLDRSLNVDNAVVLSGVVGLPLGAATVDSRIFADTNELLIQTYTAADPPVLVGAAVWFAVFVLELADVTQIGP